MTQNELIPETMCSELSDLTDRQLLEEIHAMLTTLTTAKAVKRKPSKVEYSTEFESAWGIYPMRDGSNPKKAAYAAWEKRISEGINPQIMYDGLVRYRKWCEANGNLGTGYVMQAVRFFGPSCEFNNPWPIQEKAIDWSRQDDNALLRACKERGISSHGLTRFQIIDRLSNA